MSIILRIATITNSSTFHKRTCSSAALLFFIMICSASLSTVQAYKISKDGVAILNYREQSYHHALAFLACEEDMLRHSDPPADGNQYCDPTWDGIMCWNFTVTGTVEEKPCPNYVNGFLVNEFATRECGHDGDWLFYPDKNRTWTNYSMCLSKRKPEVQETQMEENHLPYLKIMYKVGYGISFVSLVLAVFVMAYFKKLHCTRNTIHVNLFLSFILHAVCNFLRESLFVDGVGLSIDVNRTEDGHVVFIEEGSHWQCKLLITVTYYAVFTTHMWIFVEAVYLCVLLFVAVFSGKNYTAYYIVLGWTSPLLFMIPWVFVRIYLEDEFCWNKHRIEGFFWIINTPITLIVLTNFIVFLVIVWVLMTKLQAKNSNTPEARKYRYRKLARSTLVLIPLFGVYYIFTVGIPEKMSNKLAEVVVLYINLFFNSYQGFVVAMLFCFLNGEVRGEFKKKINRLRDNGFRGTRSHRPTWTTVSTYVSKARNSLYSQHSTTLPDKSENALMNGSVTAGRRSRNSYMLTLPSCDNFSSIAVVEGSTAVTSMDERLSQTNPEEEKHLIFPKCESVV